MDENNINAQGNNEQKMLDNLTSAEAIDVFIWGIMDEKGVGGGDPEVLQGVHDELRDQLMTQIDRSLVAELPDDKLEEFNKMAEEQGKINPDDLAKAIADADIDIETITANTMDKFREIYLHGAPDENKTEQNHE